MDRPTDRPWVAERVVDAALAARLIDAQLPALRPVRVEIVGEGWDNTVYLVNGIWVFRFPRREIAVELITTEARVLPRLAPVLPLAIPVPEWVGRPCADFPWPFAGYRRLAGRTADVAALDEAARARAAEPLARFLRALHAVDAAGLDLPGDTLARADMRKQAPKLLERLDTLERTGVVSDVGPWRRLVEGTSCRPPAAVGRVVHGDLYARHVLVDDDGAACGVIDWGDVHLGDPAVDLALAHGFLPSGARDAFRAAYGAIDDDTWRLAWLRALLHAVTAAVYGHDVGDTPLLREGRQAMDRLLA